MEISCEKAFFRKNNNIRKEIAQAFSINSIILIKGEEK